jgi:hypothetical protein
MKMGGCPGINRLWRRSEKVRSEDGVRYEGRWQLEHGVVTVYVGDFGPFATLTSPAGPETVARWLLREFLDGRKAQQASLR